MEGVCSVRGSRRAAHRRSRMIVHQASMPTDYKNLRNYFMNRFPGCEVQVMYEAGFQGFWLVVRRSWIEMH